ncbi:hypothetical protein Lfu02_69490 [Longispora fulva]|uniref:DUF2690 domain-containing protein n=1 Tax=Longispora fulva TaxID=619741 RepID=A0A8J7GDK4_9ACTN|nr:hypothetical protein [Longispora fulva]MBG6134512.1 hypothetical protein [Longispora fulva]GIG62577.1 hypothetical protein Lfu02_69490 [Longispora fulva]
MKWPVRLAGIALAVSAVAAGVFVTPQAALARGGCADGEDPSTFSTHRTVRSVRAASGALYELRYDDVTQCAWGRISQGHSFDSFWVDRAASLTEAYAGHWEPQLGYGLLTQGVTGAYTGAYNDSPQVMRACGSSNGQIVCTQWF